MDPIHTAARNGDLAELGRCLQMGMDVNSKDKCNRTPLHLACWAGHLDAVKVLLAAPGINVRINAQDNISALHFACQKGHVDVARALLHAGLPINGKSRKGLTPLHCACQQGSAQMVEFLISRKAAPYLEDMRSENALAKCKTDELRAIVQAAMDAQVKGGAQFKKKRAREPASQTVADAGPAAEARDEDEADDIQLKPSKAARPAVASGPQQGSAGHSARRKTPVQQAAEEGANERLGTEGEVDGIQLKTSTGARPAVASGPLMGGVGFAARPPVAGGPRPTPTAAKSDSPFKTKVPVSAVDSQSRTASGPHSGGSGSQLPTPPTALVAQGVVPTTQSVRPPVAQGPKPPQ